LKEPPTSSPYTIPRSTAPSHGPLHHPTVPRIIVFSCSPPRILRPPFSTERDSRLLRHRGAAAALKWWSGTSLSSVQLEQLQHHSNPQCRLGQSRSVYVIDVLSRKVLGHQWPHTPYPTTHRRILLPIYGSGVFTVFRSHFCLVGKERLHFCQPDVALSPF